jgi:hypothetical protein
MSEETTAHVPETMPAVVQPESQKKEKPKKKRKTARKKKVEPVIVQPAPQLDIVSILVWCLVIGLPFAAMFLL